MWTERFIGAMQKPGRRSLRFLAIATAIATAIASAAGCAHEPAASPSSDDAGATVVRSSGDSGTNANDAAALASGDVARGATVKIPLDGFALSCSGKPKLTVTDGDGGKRVVNQQLPGKGMYFLDDRFTGYGMCDLVVCSPANEASIDLVEYQSAGTRPIPPNQGGSGKAPVYRSVPLVGNVDVTIAYFANSICTVPKSVTKTFVAR